MPTRDLTLRDIYLARKRIASTVKRTPLIISPTLSEQCDASVYLKLESLQETGSFKLRGAANKLLSLTPEKQKLGVIAVSTGNHGRAVSYMSRQLGLNAVICLSELVPANKVQALRRLGAEVIVHGRSYDEAMERAAQLQVERGLTWIDPFDDPDVITGQGTIGLELMADLPEIDTAIVPLSGGGLISGVALALKSIDPQIQVIGASMDRAPVMFHSLRAGAPIEMEEEPTIADALAGGIYLNNQYTFRMVQEYVDDTLLVSEEQIAGAMAFALDQHHLVVEGGGAVGIAALLHRQVAGMRNAVVIVSGSNVHSALLARIALGDFQP